MKKGTRFGDAHFRSLAQALPNQLGRKREQEKINVTLLSHAMEPSILWSLGVLALGLPRTRK